MPHKPDAAESVAKTLANMAASAGAVYATSQGIDPYVVSMGLAALKGICDHVIQSLRARPDPGNVVARLNNERTARTIDTIHDVLVEAMGLRPELSEPIEQLADAVQATRDGRDEQRFRDALTKLFNTVMQVNARLGDIKADTAHIPALLEIAEGSEERLKRIEAVVVPRERIGEGDHRSPQFLAARVESLTAEVRDLLDTDGKARWDEISDALGEHSWQRAFELATKMEQWLNDQTDKVSPDVKIQGLLTLADVAVIRDSGFPFEDRSDLSDALRLLDKAEAAATVSIGDETANRLLRVRAKLTYIQGEHKRAHEILDQLDDPGAISIKLGMMEEESRWADASDLAHAQSEPHRKWAASGVAAHVRASQIERAQKILKWATSQDPRTSKSCALAYVMSRYTAIVGEGRGRPLLSLAEPDLDTLRTLQVILAEAFAGVFAEGPTSGLDAEALEMAILLGHVLRQTNTCQIAANQLARWKPVSPELGRAVLRGDIAQVRGLADRLLEEHGEICLTQMLAAMLLIAIDDQAARALALLLPKLDNADRHQQEEISTTVLIGAQSCAPEIVRDACQKVSATLGSEHRLATMLRAIHLAKENAVGDARSLIEPLSDNDDHIWLQLAARLAAQQAAWSDAAQYLHRISDLCGHVEAYEKEAEAWDRADQIAKCIAPLEKAHALRPTDIGITRRLVAAYHRTERYTDASRHYEYIWKAEPHTSALSLNFANALVLSGNVARATTMLEEYIRGTGDNPELLPLLTCTHLIHSQGDSARALSLLRSYSDTFRSDHRYLMAVVQFGYAANEERDAHEALAALVGMLDRGVLPEGVIWRASLDDIRQQFEASRERRTFINEQYRTGRLPWLIASNWTQPSNHSWVSWLIRTQSLVPSDHPDSVAQFSIYSTNGFTACRSAELRQLQPIGAPPKGSKIVADMSALITLHRLGVLELACAHFAKVYLPHSYRAAWVEEQAKVPHHQPSQVESRRAILQAVDNGRIRVAGDQQADSPRLNEYEEAPSGDVPVLRVLQLLTWLTVKGRLSVPQRTAVEAREHQPPVVSDIEANAALDRGVVIAEALTLQTLHDFGLLDHVCRGIQVFVEHDDLKRLQVDLRSQEMCDQAGRWHRELVSAVGAIPNVEFIPLPADSDDASHADGEEADDDDDHLMIHFGVDSALLAMKLGRPLLADDRFCQQGALNQSKNQLDAAFGSDALLAALVADGQLSTSQHVEHVLKLIRWRYKFVIPSASLLREMAFRYRDGLPGADLREVAVYVQDCMRDAGLYGGAEQVEPPISMAMKLFKAWCDAVAEFITTLWWDMRFTEEQAARLTRWATRYLLPAWPRSMGAGSTRRMAHVRRYTVLGAVLVGLFSTDDLRKAHRVLNRVRRSSGISDDELASAAELMLAAVSDQPLAIRRAAFLRVLEIVQGSRLRIPWRLVPAAQQAGVLDPIGSPPPVPDDHVATLRNREHSKRMEPICGPFSFVREQEYKVTVTYLPDALPSHQSAVRDAALENLLPDDFCPMTGPTRQALEAAAADIRSDAVQRWVPAVSQVLEPLTEDFLLNLAGFSQSQQAHYDEGSSKCWSHLIRPTAEALLAIGRDSWGLLPLANTPEDGISAACAATATVNELLDVYDNVAAHMTLAPPLDLGTQLARLNGRVDTKDDVWRCLHPWLLDVHRPWRQYHACQALLKNIHAIPEERRDEFWGHVVRIACLVRGHHLDSDEAQVWRLEAELAAHYLRAVDLGGYGLEPNRPITVSWWASKWMTERMVQALRAVDVAGQVREWRQGPLRRATQLTQHAWAWLSPAVHSPPRFATLSVPSPRSIALLVTLGEEIKSIPTQWISSESMALLQDCFCSALLTADTATTTDARRLWMWDCSLLDSTKAFVSPIPLEARSEAAIQTCAIVDELRELGSLQAALDQLTKTSPAHAIFVCSRARMYCYEHSNAADLMLPFLRKPEWRDACAVKLPLLGWELLAQGLMFLQARQGMEWAVELPYVFLRLAEASPDDTDRAAFFLVCMTMSSLAGNTAGAVKALATSEALPKLRPAVAAVRESLEAVRAASPQGIGLRMQSVLTVWDGIP